MPTVPLVDQLDTSISVARAAAMDAVGQPANPFSDADRSADLDDAAHAAAGRTVRCQVRFESHWRDHDAAFTVMSPKTKRHVRVWSKDAELALPDILDRIRAVGPNDHGFVSMTVDELRTLFGISRPMFIGTPTGRNPLHGRGRSMSGRRFR